MLPPESSAPLREARPPRWVMAIIRLGLHVLRPFLPAQLMEKIEHASLFLFMGVANNIASYIIYVSILNLFEASRTTALMGGYGLGMFIAYFNFSRFVFSSAVRHPLLRFMAAYVALYLINRLMLEGLVLASGMSDELAQALLIIPVAALSYGFNRFIVFRSPQV